MMIKFCPYCGDSKSLLVECFISIIFEDGMPAWPADKPEIAVSQGASILCMKCGEHFDNPKEETIGADP